MVVEPFVFAGAAVAACFLADGANFLVPLLLMAGAAFVLDGTDRLFTVSTLALASLMSL